MADTRIYLVTNQQTGTVRLVEAGSQSQAIRHCVQSIYRADAVLAKTLAQHMGEGIKIEKASETATPISPMNQTTNAQPNN